MARSNKNDAFRDLWFCMLVLFVAKATNAYEFKVGGENGWTIPNDSNGLNYNQWAEKNRFQIQDTLVFDYPANMDTVVQVTKEDYDNCHSATPISIFTDGHTVFKFNQSGPYYFISGLKENCFKNEKLIVVVMADRTKKPAVPHQPITAPSPSPSQVPLVPIILPPSPPPMTLEPKSPPMETNPSTAPSVEDTTHPRSDAHSIVATYIGTIGIALFPYVF